MARTRTSQFPENCIRGVKDPNHIRNGTVLSAAFCFEENSERQDGWMEQSVNWQDDDKALEFTLQQRRTDGRLRFKGGAAVLSRAEIDALRAFPKVQGKLSYERQPLQENPYHGNLLLHKDLPKDERKMVAAALALAVVRVVQPESKD